MSDQDKEKFRKINVQVWNELANFTMNQVKIHEQELRGKNQVDKLLAFAKNAGEGGAWDFKSKAKNLISSSGLTSTFGKDNEFRLQIPGTSYAIRGYDLWGNEPPRNYRTVFTSSL
jgi:hypothetical protein